MKSMECYNAVVTETPWIISLKNWKIICLYSGGVDLLKAWSEEGIYKLAIMKVFMTAGIYLSNIKTLRFHVLFIMVKQ